LLAQLDIKPQFLAQRSGKVQGSIHAFSKGAIESRIAKVGSDPGVPYLREGDTEHLVQRRSCISSVAASSNTGVNAEVIRKLRPDTAADSLEQILVQQAGTKEPCVKGGYIPKIVVTNVEGDEFVRLESDGQIASAEREPGAGWSS